MSDEKKQPRKFGLVIKKKHPEEVEPGVPIGFWTPEVLEESKRRGSLPIIRFAWADDLNVLGTFVGSPNDNRRSPERNARDLVPLPDDALVDQDNPRFPKAWFVAAAKAGRFPCVREGRRYIARWADVKAALRLEPLIPRRATTGPKEALRGALGLKGKG